MSQVKVISGAERRRPWSDEEKLALIEAAFAPGAKVARVAAQADTHILTDTDGRLLSVRVHSANVQDRNGGKLPLKASRQRFPFVARVFADGGYAGRLVHWAASKTHITLEIIRRGAHTKGFEVLPRR